MYSTENNNHFEEQTPHQAFDARKHMMFCLGKRENETQGVCTTPRGQGGASLNKDVKQQGIEPKRRGLMLGVGRGESKRHFLLSDLAVTVAPLSLPRCQNDPHGEDFHPSAREMWWPIEPP